MTADNARTMGGEIGQFAPFEIDIPATSANLGSGFDSFGLALTLGDTLEVRPSADGLVHVDVHGSGAGSVPTNHRNLVARIAADVMRKYSAKLPGINIVAHNNIPHSRGLGSSASAAVAGISIAKQLLAQCGIQLDTADEFRLATEVEGHPDNVAPAIFGGVTLSWLEDGKPFSTQIPVACPITVTVGIPDFRASTQAARKAQPSMVPLQDAVFNLSRAALLVATLATDGSQLFAATADRLHQQYRAGVMPEAAKLVNQLRERGHAAAISGAGPTVIVISADGGSNAQADMTEMAGATWRVETMTVAANGAIIRELQG